MSFVSGNAAPSSPNYMPSPWYGRHWFSLAQSFGRLIQSLFMPVKGDIEGIQRLKGRLDTLFKRDRDLNEEDIALYYKVRECYSTALKLQKGKRLDQDAVVAYAKVHKDKIDLFELFAFETPDLKAPFPPLPKLNNKPLAIPIVMKGKLRDHIVITVIDPERKQVEYYDSKGHTVKDSASRQLVSHDKTLQQLMDYIWQTYAKEERWVMLENPRRHQTDGYNCGVYVSWFLRERSDFIPGFRVRKLFQDITANSLSFKEAATAARRVMIKELLESAGAELLQHEMRRQQEEAMDRAVAANLGISVEQYQDEFDEISLKSHGNLQVPSASAWEADHTTSGSEDDWTRM